MADSSVPASLVRTAKRFDVAPKDSVITTSELDAALLTPGLEPGAMLDISSLKALMQTKRVQSLQLIAPKPRTQIATLQLKLRDVTGKLAELPSDKREQSPLMKSAQDIGRAITRLRGASQLPADARFELDYATTLLAHEPIDYQTRSIALKAVADERVSAAQRALVIGLLQAPGDGRSQRADRFAELVAQARNPVAAPYALQLARDMLTSASNVELVLMANKLDNADATDVEAFKASFSRADVDALRASLRARYGTLPSWTGGRLVDIVAGDDGFLNDINAAMAVANPDAARNAFYILMAQLETRGGIRERLTLCPMYYVMSDRAEKV